MKNTLKITIATLVIVLAFSAATQAQTLSPQMRAKMMTNRMAEQLKLKRAQLAAIYAINLKVEKNMDLAKVLCLNIPAIHKQLVELVNKKRELKLRTSLTYSQYFTYEEIYKGKKKEILTISHLEHRNPENAMLESCEF